MVRAYISGLRRALAGEGTVQPIATRAPGYQLDLDAGHLDLEVFGRHVTAAQAACRGAEHARAAAIYRSALQEWRGPALGGITGSYVEAAAVGLEERRILALEGRIECDLAVGRHADLVPELRALVEEFPLRERFWFQLMTALHRLGRSGDALAAYTCARTAFVDELGIEPGADLRRLQQAILVGDSPASPAPTSPAIAIPVNATPEAADLRPCMLPADLADFTNREPELEMVISRLDRGGSAVGRAAPPVCLITGQGGAGKTALAVHAAHLLSDTYRDGQLWPVSCVRSAGPMWSCRPAWRSGRNCSGCGSPDGGC